MYLKLSGENIVGHAHYADSDYTFLINKTPEEIYDVYKQVYKYKVVNENLVELTQQEMDNHPLKVENTKEITFGEIKDLIITRLCLQDIIAAPQTSADIKARAQAKLTKTNQRLLALLGG